MSPASGLRSEFPGGGSLRPDASPRQGESETAAGRRPASASGRKDAERALPGDRVPERVTSIPTHRTFESGWMAGEGAPSLVSPHRRAVNPASDRFARASCSIDDDNRLEARTDDPRGLPCRSDRDYRRQVRARSSDEAPLRTSRQYPRALRLPATGGARHGGPSAATRSTPSPGRRSPLDPRPTRPPTRPRFLRRAPNTSPTRAATPPPSRRRRT